jgi:hypothetical protein
MRRPRLVVVAAAFVVGVLGARAPEARAYDPATTSAGLTQRAVVASELHEVLAHRLGRALGLFETLTLAGVPAPGVPPASVERRLLWGRLTALDSSAGYRPSDDGRASALAWVVAGSVIAKTPPERLQNMFFDPSTRMGLRDASALDGFAHTMRLAADTGGLRALATGTSFSLEGMSALEWVESPRNDLGLPAFFAHVERSVVATESAERDTELVQALLALGGVLAVLEDMGNPAQVRNDFRGAYLRGGVGSPFDRASGYDRAVADLYGVLGIPSPKTVVRRATWRDYFTGADGLGLADRTQARFFSDGTVPDDAPVDRDTTMLDVLTAARQSLTYALPAIPRLELRPMGLVEHVLAPDIPPGATHPRALLAYERVPGRVRFFLDARVYADTARTLLPEIAGYAAGLVDHLFRARLTLAASGGRVRASVSSSTGGGTGGASDAGGQPPRGEVQFLVEDAHGRRRALGTVATVGDGDRAPELSVSVPADARRVVAFLRGADGAGPVVAFAVLTLPARP